MKNIFVFSCLLVLAACQSESSSKTGNGLAVPATRASISGTVTYPERILLQPGSQLSVVLEDVSQADAPARQIARLDLSDPGQVPIAFELEYNPADIDESRSYALRAKIMAADGSLLFIDDARTPVITHDAGNHADIVLVGGGHKSTAAGQPDNPGHLTEIDVAMDLKGEFSYMADAALFRDCRSGKAFPVEMSGQYMELERAYLNSGIEPGAALVVDLRGRYSERLGMQENTNEVKLIVEEFQNVSEFEDCTPDHHTDLRNTYWKLLSLGGERIKPEPDQREAHLILRSEENRVNGNGGCNSFFGSYTLNDTVIGFSGLGSTMMACVAGMETEQAFLLALNEANRVLVEGPFMELFKNDTRLARFEAIYY